MSTFIYQSDKGDKVEGEFPIGQAPKSLQIGEVIYERYYGPETMPVVRTLSPLDRGDRPSVSHQLPRWYGYGQRETVWKEHMAKLGVEDTPHRRMQVTKVGMGPKPREIERRSREAAIRAGAASGYTKDGKVLARTKGAVQDVVAKAKDRGDQLAWD